MSKSHLLRVRRNISAPRLAVVASALATVGIVTVVMAHAATDCANTAPCSTAGTAVANTGWTLKFDDEFNGTSLDTTKWDANWYGEGGSMNNVGTYAANTTVSNGTANLVLASSGSGALIHTNYGSGRYQLPVGGYAEARVQFAGGTTCNNWAAWWASGPSWPSAGEHDIAEVLSGQLTVNYHSPSGSHNQGAVAGTWCGTYHTYGLWRKAGSAEVYWDGVKVKSYTTDDNGGGEELILNVGSGSSYGTAGMMKVDWVRAWAPSGTAPVPSSSTPAPVTSTPVPSVTAAAGSVTSINDATTGTGLNQFNFSGSWLTSTPAGAYNTDNHYSNLTGNYYSVQFNGTQASIYSEKNTDMGIAGISIDGGGETQVDAYASARAEQQLLYTSPVLASGTHTIKVRITGSKNAASTGTYAAADRVDVVAGAAPTPTPAPSPAPTPTPPTAGSITTLNDATTGTGLNQFNFAGTWSTSAPVGAYNNDNHYDNISGDAYSVQFSGTGAKIYSEMNSDLGIAGISIDGGTETMVDAYAAARAEQQLLYASPVLANGTHTLKVRITGVKNAASTGTYASADRVDIVSGSAATPTPIPSPVSAFGSADLNHDGTVNVFDLSILLSDWGKIFPTPTPSPTPFVDTTPPSAPSALSAAAISAGQINLNWTASTDNVGVDHYNIVRGGTVIGTAPGSSHTYADITVLPGTAYTYTVKAVDAALNESAASGAATATTPAATDTTPPSAPANLTATALSGTQVNLTWSAATDNVGVAGYQIFRNGTQISTATGTSYGDSNGLVAGTTYSYTVKAVDSSGNLSAASNTATVTTPGGTTPSPSPSPAPVGLSSTNPCGVTAAAPATYKHVIVIFDENHPYESVINNAAAPYITSMSKLCGSANNFSATSSPSRPNYLAATSGSDYGFTDNNDPSSSTTVTADNIFRQVRAAGGTAKSYQESMPSNCYLFVSSDSQYKPKHNPAAYYVGGSDRTACLNDDVPMGTTTSGAFASALASESTLPTFSFITPNMCNDMHDCSVATGDAWMKSWLPKILDSPAYKAGNTAVMFVFDEANGSTAGTFAIGYPDPTIFFAPSATKGKVSTIKYNQYNLNRTLSEMLGLPLLQKGATSASMRSDFNI